LAAHKDAPIWPEPRGDHQREFDEPGRRNEHEVGGLNPETSELTDCNLSTPVFDMMIASLLAPAIQVQG
jgi:hypothetical protein